MSERRCECGETCLHPPDHYEQGQWFCHYHAPSLTERDALRAEGLQHKKDIITLIKERDKFKAEVEQLTKQVDELEKVALEQVHYKGYGLEMEAHNARLRGALETIARWPYSDGDSEHIEVAMAEAAQALADSAPGDNNPDHDPSKEM